MLFCHLPFYIHCLFYFSTLFVILLLHTLFLPVTIIYGYCHNGRRLVLQQRDCDPLITQKPEKESKEVTDFPERRAKPMSIVDFIAVVSFGLTCFCAGYTFGKDNNKPQKQPPTSGKLSGNFCQTNLLGLAVYRQYPFLVSYYHTVSDLSKHLFSSSLLHRSQDLCSLAFQSSLNMDSFR